MIDLQKVGAFPLVDNGTLQIKFGIYLPGITFNKGYRLKVRIIHDFDQFVRGIEPKDFWLSWENGSEYDYWESTVTLTSDPESRFGQPGRYLYRYQLLRGDKDVTFWFSDPFGRESGIGTLSAVTVDPAKPTFFWHDNDFSVPEVDRMVVYELNVREFNRDFEGVVTQLNYLSDLGVNVLELMPISNVKEDVEWGYTPLGYFSPDERLGGADGLKRLVDECHVRGIAVILDAVYAHAHPEFPYTLVYQTSGEPNPMMGKFAGEFFGNDNPGTDYRKPFTYAYFLALNQYYLTEYHIDGFRYDYVPGMYDGFMGEGYAKLVFDTYQYSKTILRFQEGQRSKIIQCAEHLPNPVEVLSKTYTNCCWQNGLLDLGRSMASGHDVKVAIAHQLDPEFNGYPTTYQNPTSGEQFPVAPFQYVESHDHKRFINAFGETPLRDLLNQTYGNRALFYKMQPYIIAMYTGKGIPMLWQGQEFGENYGVPNDGIGRNLFERPLHWEYFYDTTGKALIRLHRKLGTLRRTNQAFGSRGYFYYFFDQDHLNKQVIAYQRNGLNPQPEQSVLVALNFSNQDQQISLSFPAAGQWHEQLEGAHPTISVIQNGQYVPVTVPSNYGVIFSRQ